MISRLVLTTLVGIPKGHLVVKLKDSWQVTWATVWG